MDELLAFLGGYIRCLQQVQNAEGAYELLPSWQSANVRRHAVRSDRLRLAGASIGLLPLSRRLPLFQQFKGVGAANKLTGFS